MVSETEKVTTQILKDEVIRGVQEKNGLKIKCLNLGSINSTVCDYFVICHGTSSTHVGAIADSVEEQVNKHIGIKPRRKEGSSNSQWILLDYMDVVLHVFDQEVRDFYALEELWADAPMEKV